MPLIELRNASRFFTKPDGTLVRAVNDVSLAIEPGTTTAIIGESGSGKSTLGRLVLGLLTVDSGQVLVEGMDLATLRSSEMRKLRARLGVVFQEPYESLNPRLKIASIVAEPLAIHRPELPKAERRGLVEAVLKEVDLDPAVADRYPHALSGGQQQRVGIARALIAEPTVVVLDEPTSSLDLSVRAQILTLLSRLQKARNLTFLMITHDLPSVEYFADDVAVMHLGRVVEAGRTQDVIGNPQHAYTKELLSARLSVEV